MMSSNSCFSKIIADVFPPWHRVNTHLDAAEQQTDKASAFIEVLTSFHMEAAQMLLLLHFGLLLAKLCPGINIVMSHDVYLRLK